MTSIHVIEIPFNAWSKDKLQKKKKRCTSRNHVYGIEGDVFIVEDKYYMIKHIIKLPLSFVRDFLYELEGADSPGDFVNVWNAIPRHRFNENNLVWVHFFDEINKPGEQ